MAHLGADVLGIDLADKGLKVASLHAAQSQASVSYRHIATEDLARECPGEFDVVTCMEMLEHVPDPEKIVTACAQALKPGGWVFFSTINRTPLSWFVSIFGAEVVMRILPRGTHDYAKFIRPAELEQMAAQAGLLLVERKGLRYNPLNKTFSLRRWTGINYLLAMRKSNG
jgi:2-polyprenyl-6-hydroxyphenyl methylase/3-demethylubiquinone-9 3-methyltransferase